MRRHSVRAVSVTSKSSGIKGAFGTRRLLVMLLSVALLVGALPAAASAHGRTHRTRHDARLAMDGPDPAFWLSDPDGVDGVSGTEQFDPVVGSSGWATVHRNRARIKIRATGLEPGHTYTMWVVYFNDSSKCVEGCNGPDLVAAGGGVIWGAGKIARRNGRATFTARLKTGNGAAFDPTPPPPFAHAPYEAGPNNEFHVVIRSHGPKIRGEIREQLTQFGGGCEVNVGPPPEGVGDFPVPAAPGECGDVQLYVFK